MSFIAFRENEFENVIVLWAPEIYDGFFIYSEFLMSNLWK